MSIRLAVTATYFGLLLLIGFLARSRSQQSPGQYFLAGRSLAAPVLIATMAATNFSAFTVFGVSGAAYRDGLAFFPIMAFGTGFMALTFWLVGRKAREWGSAHNLITPSELVSLLYDSVPVARVTALVLVVFTVPYLALQPMAAGVVLNQIFGLPSSVGAVAVTGAIVLYTLRGGMRAVAWTDALQGTLMLVLMLVALGMVVGFHGGWVQAFSAVAGQEPALFSRPGLQGTYTPALWFSFLALWFFCDPMFPQLFQRFYAARDEKTIGWVVLWYPAICILVFAPPVLLGTLGQLAFPGLAGNESDGILAMVMISVGGNVAGTLVLVAGLAALMSTMDSQLLTLSSIFSRDIWPVVAKGRTASMAVARVFVLVLAALGLALALATDATILDLGVTAFTGLAVLFPSVLFGLYLRQPRSSAALASIVVGEAIVVASHLGVLPAHGFLSAIPVMIGSTVVYLAVHFATGPAGLPVFNRRQVLFTLGFGGIFLLAQDYWRWEETGALVLGLPAWCWYFVGLSVAQMILSARMLRKPRRVTGTTNLRTRIRERR